MIGADRVHHIHEVVTGQVAARENDDEFIFCGTYGMGCLDLTIADKLYRNAVEMGLGTKLVQWDNPLWV
jgi:ornithine cyclodeaminase